MLDAICTVFVMAAIPCLVLLVAHAGWKVFGDMVEVVFDWVFGH